MSKPPPMVHFVDQIDSTNLALRAMLGEGSISKGSLWARSQSAGRGRRGRSWLSPEGGLYFSACCPTQERPPILFSIAVGLAAYQLVSPMSEAISLKWPNDLIATSQGRDAKLGGILSEYVTGLGSPHVIVGIGINANAPVSLPDADPQALPATSLQELSGSAQDLPWLVGQLNQSIHHSFDQILASEDAASGLLASWREATSTLGRRVRIEQASGDIEGVAVAIGDDFCLVVEDAQGRRHAIHAGDCIHLRARPAS